MWGLIEASERGWTNPTILGAFAVGAAIIGMFIAWERRTDHPMLDVSVFRNLRFSAASLAVGFVFFALMGVVYFLTTYLQSVMGYDALEAGVRMLPVVGGLIAATKLSLALTERFGTKVVVAMGLSTVGAALFVLAGCRRGHRLRPCCHRPRHDGLRHVPRDVARHRVDHGLAAEGEGGHRVGHE